MEVRDADLDHVTAVVANFLMTHDQPPPLNDYTLPLYILMNMHIERQEQKRQAMADRRRQRKKRRQPRFWVSPLLREERRLSQGWYANLMREMQQEDIGDYKNFLSITPEMFNEFLQGIRPLIQKKDTNWRKCIPPEIRLAATLRYLATGCSQQDLKYGFRIGRSTATKVITDTCNAIVEVFLDRYIATPATTEEWTAVCEQFERKWNFPHALGAIDGKHVRIRKPRSAHSDYFNYKKFHSIILLAVADANYKFLYVNCGAKGRAGDSGIFEGSDFQIDLDGGDMPIPPAQPLPSDNSGVKVPYFFLSDDAFACTPRMLKPVKYAKLKTSWAEECSTIA